MRVVMSFILLACFAIVLGTVSAQVDVETTLQEPLPATHLRYIDGTEAHDAGDLSGDEEDTPPTSLKRTIPEGEVGFVQEAEAKPEVKSPESETEESEQFEPESSSNETAEAFITKPSTVLGLRTTANTTEALRNAAIEPLRVLANLEKNIIDVLDNTLGNASHIVPISAAGTGVHNTYSYPHRPSYTTSHDDYQHHQPHIHYDDHHVKPLKPSVVHRDPHAHFDHYDAIRTKDHDRPRHHQHGHGPPAEHGHAGYPHEQYGTGHGYGHGGSRSHFQPYHYDTHKVPECAHENRRYYNLTFCLEDHYYPTETIEWALRQHSHSAQRLLSDVTYQSADNLVDGLTRSEEEGYTYSHYYGATHQQHHQLDRYKPPYTGYSYSEEYYKKGGYICPSDIFYARPRRAMNTYGKWKVIVNLDYVPVHGHGNGLGNAGAHHDGHSTHHQTHTQTLRLEQCIYPEAPCSYIDSHYHSQCLQKHNFVRLVAWTHKSGLHIDTFKMPIACSCHVQQPTHYYSKPPPPQVHHHNHNVHHPHPPPHPSPAPFKLAKHGEVIANLHQGKANLLTSFLG